MPAAFIRIDGETVEGMLADLASDRGLALGDGVFRTLRVRAGRIAAWSLHRDKLLADAARLNIVPEPSALDRLDRDLADLSSRLPQAVARITLTAGSGPRGYRRPAPARPRVLIRAEVAEEGDDDAARPLRARLCELRLSFQPRLAGIKHLNRLEQVLARAEWCDPVIDEGLMLDAEGVLVCGTMSNLFLLVGERLLTPRIDRCGVSGVQRARVMAWAHRHGVEVEETRVPIERLDEASALLLCNSVMGARWVESVDGRPFGGPPALLDALQAWLKAD